MTYSCLLGDYYSSFGWSTFNSFWWYGLNAGERVRDFTVSHASKKDSQGYNYRRKVYFNKFKAFQNGNKVLDKYFKIIFGMQFHDDNRLNFRLLDGRVMNDLIGQYIFRTLRDTSTQVLKMWFIDNVCLWFLPEWGTCQ